MAMSFDLWYKTNRYSEQPNADPFYMRQAWEERERMLLGGYVTINCPLLDNKMATITLPRTMPRVDVERLRKWVELALEAYESVNEVKDEQAHSS